MKIASLQCVISPEIGSLLAGYAPHDVSVARHDDLMLNGICMDDGKRRVLLLSFDLLGLAGSLIQQIRKQCAELLGASEEDIVLTCTHTHGGPHCRNGAKTFPDEKYCDFLLKKTIEAVKTIPRAEFTEVSVFFYSADVPVNVNRRYCGPENAARFLPHHRSLEALADGFCDSEVGMLFFFHSETGLPLEVLVNFAAHPLVSHAPGLGGLAITADYPARLRLLVEEATGAHCTFVSGAAGDMFPKESEIGFHALDSIAGPLANAVVRGMVDAQRNPKKFKLDSPELRTAITTFHAEIRKTRSESLIPILRGKELFELELQFLAVGDLCFVGVPCELLAETGMEIKWHSPFRRAYILYNSTDYLSYICHFNALVAGGYEADSQMFEPITGLKLVNAAVEGMLALKESAVEKNGRPQSNIS